MSTSAVNNDSQWWISPTNTDSNNTDTKGKNTLSDFNTFMKLLATELQNQDPSNPVSNTEYVAQLAQMESLSQLQNMSNVLTNNSAYDLIGASVTYQLTDSATGVTSVDTGIVKAAVIKDGTTYLMVNGQMVKPSAVIMVAPAATNNANSK